MSSWQTPRPAIPVAPTTRATISMCPTPSAALLVRSTHLDHDLHFLTAGVQQREKALFDDVFGFDAASDDFLDRQLAARNHADDARPHRHFVAPGRLDGNVLQRPQGGIDEGLLDVQAG